VNTPEADFQRAVIELAQWRGWRVAHFRKAQNRRGDWRTPVAADGRGFPDLVLVRERVLFVELKTDSGRVSPEQRAWLESLRAAGAGAHVWRPRDWSEIQRELENPPTEAGG